MTPSEAPRLPGWVTASEVAEELGISRQTVNQMFWAGEFESLHRVGADTRKPMFVVATEEYERIKATRTFPRSRNTEEHQTGQTA